MPQAIYGFSITVAGLSASKQVTRTADHPNPYQVELAAAKPLTSWVKTDANTAAGNLPAGHGYANGKFDVYWDGGQRYDVDGTITTNALALDGGSGTDFPASADATVRVCRQVPINTAIDGDAVKIGFIKLGYTDTAAVARGRLLFEDAAGDDIADLDTVDGINANTAKIFDIEGGDTNPLTGDPIVSCKASHSNVSAAATLEIGTLEDATP
jgi:hypothetical protein